MKREISATIDFFRAVGAKNIRNADQLLNEFKHRVPGKDGEEVYETAAAICPIIATTREGYEEERALICGTYERSMAVALTLDYNYYRSVFTICEQKSDCFGGRILVVGCGNGLLSCYLARLKPDSKVIGIDDNPTEIEYAQRLAQKLSLSNVSFEVCDPDSIPAEMSSDTVILSRMLRRRSIVPGIVGGYMDLRMEAEETRNACGKYALPLASLVADGGRAVIVEDMAFTPSTLGIVLAFADAGLVWNRPDSERNDDWTRQNKDRVYAYCPHVMFFDKTSAKADIDALADDFATQVPNFGNVPDLYIDESAMAKMHQCAGDVIAGFSAIYEFADDSEPATGVAVIAWKDRADVSTAWLEVQSGSEVVIRRYPIEKADWLAGEVWANARIAAEDLPDSMQLMSGSYGHLERLSDVTDFSTLPQGNPDSDDEPKRTSLLDTKLKIDLAQSIKPLSELGKDQRVTPKSKFEHLFDSGKSDCKKEAWEDLPSAFRIMQRSGSSLKNRKRKRPLPAMSGSADTLTVHAEDDGMSTETHAKTSGEKSEVKVGASRRASSGTSLRLAFISKKQRLTIEDMASGNQWMADTKGVRIENDAIGHVDSRKIENTDFMLSTSDRMIVLRDNSCGYEFTIKMA